tara:strand:+ start:679 stop:1002 length:324 start_codon:yes stop_codon:yes gene_type:complete
MTNATRKWIFLKVSSLLMVPFMIWFLIKFVSIYDGNYQKIVEFFSTQPSTIIFSIFIVITFFHSALSISEIFEDYIDNKKTRKFANIMVYLSSFIIPAITIITLIRL